MTVMVFNPLLSPDSQYKYHSISLQLLGYYAVNYAVLYLKFWLIFMCVNLIYKLLYIKITYNFQLAI